MFKNYFKTAWRNLTRNKIYAAINITGIAIGLAAFWLITLYVGDELSYDQSFTNANRICRVVQHATWEGGSMNTVPTSPPFATAFKNKFPEVEDAARIDLEGGGVIHYGDKTFKQDDICFSENALFKLFDDERKLFCSQTLYRVCYRSFYCPMRNCYPCNNYRADNCQYKNRNTQRNSVCIIL